LEATYFGMQSNLQARLVEYLAEGGGESGCGTSGYVNAKHAEDDGIIERKHIKNHIVQVDRQRIKQGLGTAVNTMSNVSLFALKPLRDLQLAEKLNAFNIDMEEEEARKEIA